MKNLVYANEGVIVTGDTNTGFMLNIGGFVRKRPWDAVAIDYEKGVILANTGSVEACVVDINGGFLTQWNLRPYDMDNLKVHEGTVHIREYQSFEERVKNFKTHKVFFPGILAEYKDVVFYEGGIVWTDDNHAMIGEEALKWCKEHFKDDSDGLKLMTFAFPSVDGDAFDELVEED